MFAAGACFSCHRMNGRGGALAPDLSSVGGRFGALDIAQSILEPSRVISDQYRAVDVHLEDGEVVTGRVINVMQNMFGLDLEGFQLNTDMQSQTVRHIKPGDAVRIVPSDVSMMPGGLVNAMNEDEFLDLIAYLVSGGDPDHAVFR